MFNHPQNVKVPNIKKTLAEQNFSYSELLCLTAQKVAFISKKQYRLSAITFSQSVSYAQVTSAAEVSENNSDTEYFQAQSTGFQETFQLLKHIPELLEPYRAKNSEVSHIEILKKHLHGYHAAFFSCAKLQLSPKIMQHSFYWMAIWCHNTEKSFDYQPVLQNLTLKTISYWKIPQEVTKKYFL